MSVKFKTPAVPQKKHHDARKRLECKYAINASGRSISTDCIGMNVMCSRWKGGSRALLKIIPSIHNTKITSFQRLLSLNKTVKQRLVGERGVLKVIDSYDLKGKIAAVFEAPADRHYVFLRELMNLYPKGLPSVLIRHVIRSLIKIQQSLAAKGLAHFFMSPDSIVISVDGECLVQVIDVGSVRRVHGDACLGKNASTADACPTDHARPKTKAGYWRTSYMPTSCSKMNMVSVNMIGSNMHYMLFGQLPRQNGKSRTAAIQAKRDNLSLLCADMLNRCFGGNSWLPLSELSGHPWLRMSKTDAVEVLTLLQKTYKKIKRSRT